jgi:hypothetical protein
MRRGRYALPLALMFLPAVSFAAVQAGEKAGWSGAGTMSCGEVTAALQQHPEDENLFFSWAQGFMSGLNTELLKRGETDLNGRSLDTQKQFISSYCKEHPRAPYFEAVFKLYDGMRHDQGLPSYVRMWQEPQKK